MVFTILNEGFSLTVVNDHEKLKKKPPFINETKTKLKKLLFVSNFKKQSFFKKV